LFYLTQSLKIKPECKVTFNQFFSKFEGGIFHILISFKYFFLSMMKFCLMTKNCPEQQIPKLFKRKIA
jgi:hypothetical protein